MLRRNIASVVLTALGIALVACAKADDDPAAGAAPVTSSAPSLASPTDGGGARDAKPGSCTKSTDCPAPPACEEAACVDGACVQRPIKCSGGTECAPSACDPATSKCVTAPADDRTACNKGFGQCVAGKCEEVGTCFGDSPQQYLHCDGTNYRDLSTSLYPKSRVDTYACAAGETTPEVALEFDPPVGSTAKLTLTVTDAADADLDLIVLEADCTGVATCAAQSITAGTGTESATFVAQPNRKYYVVVDGKVTTPTKFRIQADCL